VNHKGIIKEFQGTYTIKDAVFNVACAWNSVKAKTLCRAWRKLWPAVMFAMDSLDEEDFVGFNVCNKDTVHKMFSMFKELSPSNPECEVSQVDAEEWIDADKGIEVSHTTTDDDLINAVMNPDAKNKNFQMKSPQIKFLGLKLPTLILHF
jgi:hypothetical protein